MRGGTTAAATFIFAGGKNANESPAFKRVLPMVAVNEYAQALRASFFGDPQEIRKIKSDMPVACRAAASPLAHPLFLRSKNATESPAFERVPPIQSLIQPLLSDSACVIIAA